MRQHAQSSVMLHAITSMSARAWGERFLAAADSTVEHLLDWPNAGRLYPGLEEESSIRTKRIHGFPYRIVYLTTDSELAVFAYAHDSREPNYWRHRLQG